MNTPNHNAMESSASNYKFSLDQLKAKGLPMPLTVNDYMNLIHYGVPVLSFEQVPNNYLFDCSLEDPDLIIHYIRVQGEKYHVCYFNGMFRLYTKTQS